MTKVLTTPNGRKIVAGLKQPENPKPSTWQKLVYDQEGSKYDSLFNIYRLQKTDDLKGWDMMQARCSNVAAVLLNPFAAAEVWRNIFAGNTI